MKSIKLFALLVIFLTLGTSSAQNRRSFETYGKTFNLGLGVGGYSGYYGYYGRSLAVFHANYEFEAGRNFTLAPFATFYSFADDNYRETVVPLGVKGSLYLDKLLLAGSKWDFYGAGSLGFAFVGTRWNNDYTGDRNYYRKASPLFLDFHLGAEYHFNSRIGAFLDLSTGVSTIGISFR